MMSGVIVLPAQVQWNYYKICVKFEWISMASGDHPQITNLAS